MDTQCCRGCPRKRNKEKDELLTKATMAALTPPLHELYKNVVPLLTLCMVSSKSTEYRESPDSWKDIALCNYHGL